MLSSSWRMFEAPRERLAGALAGYGLGYRHCTTTQLLPGGRAAQILDWIGRHGHNVLAWAVVDDESVVPDAGLGGGG